MEDRRCAVGLHATAFFVTWALLAFALRPQAASAQLVPAPLPAATASVSALDLLVQQAVDAVVQRYARPLGNVAERKRGTILALFLQAPPPPGTRLEAFRPDKQRPGTFQPIATLEIVRSEPGISECKEVARTGRAHAEAGDVLRSPQGAMRLLVAPCVPLVDLAPEIPDVVGEKLRAALLARPSPRVVDDMEAERRAEVAYLSGGIAAFLAQQAQANEVLYPVLLQTETKLILNLEYYSVRRGRATDIDVASVGLDDMLRSWLRAGRPYGAAPPGFRRLATQLYPWHALALCGAPGGGLVAIDRDTVHVLEFYYPGLRAHAHVPLGRRAHRRREPSCVVLQARDLAAAAPSFKAVPAVYILSDERAPQMLSWSNSGTADAAPQLRPAPAELEPALERIWSAPRGTTARKPEPRWWPAPDQSPSAMVPCFADLDADGRADLVWSNSDGALRVKLAAQRATWSFPGFGDIKAVQSPRGGAAPALLWLTDPVWHGAPDRLHSAELAADDLKLGWTSQPFAGTLVALSCADLNEDGIADLIVAEDLKEGTRLHAFLALPSDHPQAPASNTSPGSGGAGRP